MHPEITQALVKYRIEEQLKYAEQERRARQAGVDRPHWIDFASIGQSLRVRLSGGSALRGKPASAGA